MTKEQFLQSIKDVSEKFPQGVPSFIADQYGEVANELVAEGALIKMKAGFSGFGSEFYVLSENKEKCQNKLGLKIT